MLVSAIDSSPGRFSTKRKREGERERERERQRERERVRQRERDLASSALRVHTWRA